MFVNRMPRWEVLDEGGLQTIEGGWRHLVADIGVRFDHPRAQQLFAAAGQKVEDELVRFDPEFLLEMAALAPPQFGVAARNPARSIVVGGDHMVFAATNGPPFILEGDERREATMADVEKLLMLAQMTDALDTPGRNIVEPNDVPLDVRHLLRSLAAIRLTDRVWSGEVSSASKADDCLRLAEIAHGGRLLVDGNPVLFANVNVNSPLHFDASMLEGLLGYAGAGQAIIVTPFLLMGAMSPVTVAAALAQQTAEALAGVALVQLVRPGTPSVLGSFLSSTDMKSGSPAFGGPESAIGLAASGQIARRLGLPWRSGGGTLTASHGVDYQSGYESFNTQCAAFLAGANVCWQSAGWLEGGLSVSLEKFVADCEVLDLLLHQFSPLQVDEPALAASAYDEVGSAGHFFGVSHTLEHFRDCFWRPTVATTDNYDRWKSRGSATYTERAGRRCEELLEGYTAPPLEAGVEDELWAFVERRAAELGDPVRRGA